MRGIVVAHRAHMRGGLATSRREAGHPASMEIASIVNRNADYRHKIEVRAAVTITLKTWTLYWLAAPPSSAGRCLTRTR